MPCPLIDGGAIGVHHSVLLSMPCNACRRMRVISYRHVFVSLVERLLYGLDPALERSHLALQEFQPSIEVFPLGLPISEERLDPTQPLQNGLILLLQTFQPVVEVIEVADDLAKALVDPFEALVVLGELGVDPIEAPVDGLEAPVDFLEFPAQELD